MQTITRDKLDLSKTKAPTGSAITCKGWIQEAALRMLHNNLDPDVAERPEDLVVYGGNGEGARKRPPLLRRGGDPPKPEGQEEPPGYHGKTAGRAPPPPARSRRLVPAPPSC